MLSADELLAGGAVSYEVAVPADVLAPGDGSERSRMADGNVRLRPLTVGDMQLVQRAARERDALVGPLLVHKALVEPELTVQEVASLHIGLLQFLLREVNRISGIDVGLERFKASAAEPIARAAHILAREFGWTPQEVNELTLGQIMLHLQMLAERTPE